MKYAAKMFYIYLAIITINTFINIILLGVIEMETITSIISNSSSMETVGYDKIIFKIDQVKVNIDLV